MKLPALNLVTTLPALHDLAQQLQEEPLVAVDTESNSLYAYRERVCLIQVSTRTQDWVIDPLAIEDLSGLGPIFADEQIEKVFHAAEYDILSLKRDYQFTFANVFDTMHAARIIGMKQFSLANMLEEHFGVKLDKRFQRADWSARPLTGDLLAYARLDTHYLPALRDILFHLISHNGFLPEAHETFAMVCEAQPSARAFDPDGYWYISAAQDFNRREMAMLRELYLYREHLASTHDQPPFKIMGDETMVNIVLRVPETVADLSRLRGLGSFQVERYGAGILHALQRGKTAKVPPRPDRAPRMDAVTLTRYNALRDWRKERATERGVESDVIIPKEALLALARVGPQSVEALEALEHIPGFGPWRRTTYGPELINILAGIQITEEDNGA